MAAWAGPGDDTDEEIRLCRIPRAERLYDDYLAGRRKETGR